MLQKEELTPIFNEFNKQKVLIVGDVMIDAYIWGKVERISPEAPVPVVSVTRRENMLGGAANVARNIKALGATPLLCSVTGNDAKGKEFIELMRSEGIDPIGIVTSQKRITTTKFRVIGNNTQMLRVDEEVDHDLDSHETSMLLQRVEQLLLHNNINVILLQDYNKGVLSAPVIDALLKLANKRQIPIVVDPKKKNFERYVGVKLFKPNMKELREGVNSDLSIENEAPLLAAIMQLQQQQQLEMVMVTMSEKGMVLRYKNDGYYLVHQQPAHLRSIADVSGAGDTVISVAALCVAIG
ncbi:MAG: bifunctional ADP-heptose synthase, partial [Bacteroidales bacterium]|nr:bifunctional ADP-heptose synthase [Bacteroidales bacterium]